MECTPSIGRLSPTDRYRGTAIDEIRPVDVDGLTSQRFREKRDRVTPEQVDAITVAIERQRARRP
jgi:hypothetical protein